MAAMPGTTVAQGVQSATIVITLAAITKRGHRARPCIAVASPMRGPCRCGHAGVESAGTGGEMANAYCVLQPLEGMAKVRFARE